jgi:hypothetical protein
MQSGLRWGAETIQPGATSPGLPTSKRGAKYPEGGPAHDEVVGLV